MPHPLPLTRVPALLFDSAADADSHAALVVAGLVRERNSGGQRTVLGLPTGSTPIGVYRELIRLHQEEGLDFSNVVTFNLDEYWPMPPDDRHSYHHFMRETFFDHVNIKPENAHLPPGDVPRRDVDAACAEYEAKIRKAGGIDLQLLGIGRTGHIGFNEPGSPADGRTRFVTLDPLTRADAAAGFFGEENVPLHALTMGVGTIREARKILVLALGEHKAPVVRSALEDAPTDRVPATLLNGHPDLTYLLDRGAAAELTTIKMPWRSGPIDWDDRTETKAVVWVSEQSGKALTKLQTRDLLEHDLHELLRERGPVETLRNRVFDRLDATLCTHPAGDGTKRKKKVLVFSPHPDDDVISMGGTLILLCDHGHEVHVAYQTSGATAVFDHDVRRHLDFVSAFGNLFDVAPLVNEDAGEELPERLIAALADKPPGEPDSPEVWKLKALIRRTEAVAAAEEAGVPRDRCHFQNLPFYETGRVKKQPIGDADVQNTVELLRSVQPDQVYLAGDLRDPHGTHRRCARVVGRALEEVQKEGLDPEVWRYRGAWQEFEPHEIDRAVPISPEVTARKRRAIFKHETQKDRPVFPGHDDREFWVRAEERTKATAAAFDALGLPEHFAIEAFARGPR
ncbi:glucosamine-6-phosphate deaminase [Alienimonas sp. DA493]|uniref:glucosamine-6-phosphate deaminase n=1 Tax=Alienimonas sp. DA493 TaxID=3373605 RepID=UPI003753F623